MVSMSKGGADVIPFGKVKADMRFPMIEEVRAYWEALRSGRPVPLRSEVDPRGIERALENTFVLERIAPGVARFRIAGMHLNDLMGMEVRGMPLTAFFTPKGREEMADLLEAVFAGPQSLDLLLTGERGIGKPALEARMLILPLKSDAGDVNRALGCLCSVGPAGRSPRRFDIVERRVTTIGAGATGMRSVPDSAARPAPGFPQPVAQQSGFGEPLTPFAAAADQPTPLPRPARGRPALRLVKSDE